MTAADHETSQPALAWKTERTGFKKGSPRIKLQTTLRGVLISITVGDIPGGPEAEVKLYANGAILMTEAELTEINHQIRLALEEVRQNRPKAVQNSLF